MGIFEKISKEVAEKKLVRDRERRQRSLLKKAKVGKNPTLEFIDFAIVEYAKTGKTVESDQLTDVQKNNPEFMLKLYATDGYSTLNSPSEELQNNEDFMVRFFKILAAEERKRWKIYVKRDIEWALNSYPETIKRVSFLTKLSKIVPDIHVLKLLDNAVNRYNTETNQPLYEKIRDSLPVDVIRAQARDFGHFFVSYVPATCPHHVEAVRSGVFKDGFHSLSLLDKKYILENKDLIVDAFDNKHYGGIAGLKYYLGVTLSPRRKEINMNNKKPCETIYFDEDYLNIQRALLSDKDLWEKIGSKMTEEEKKDFNIDLCYFRDGLKVNVFEQAEVCEATENKSAEKPQELKK